MRVGFVTQLLWHRYGGFWRRIFEDAGADVLFASSEEVLARLEDRRLAAIPGLSFRLAAAQALVLAGADVIVAPSLNAGSEAQRGGGQDPWIADFPAALGTVGGLPSVLGVPAWLSPDQESLVVSSLQQATRDGALTKRVLGKRRAELRREKPPEPAWGTAPAGQSVVGLVGQPWLLTPALLARAAPSDSRVISQQQLDPLTLREQGSRVDPRMIPTDQEVLGAVQLLSRRGSVSELHLIIDESSGSDLWLRDRVAKQTSKKLFVHGLGNLLAGEGPESLLRLQDEA